MYSSLNDFRVIFNYMVPIIIFFTFYFINFKNNLNHAFLEIPFLSLLIIISLFHSLGLLEISGEAIVRLTSAISFISFFLFLFDNNSKLYSIFTLPLMNVYFFCTIFRSIII